MSNFTGSQAPAWEPPNAKLRFAPGEAAASLECVPKQELGNERNRRREASPDANSAFVLHQGSAAPQLDEG